MRGLTAAALAGLMLLGLAGCKPLGLRAVAPQMMPNQVEQIMGGPPTRVIRGDGADIGKMSYIYPTGRIHFVNLRVVLVEPAGEQRTITERAREKKREEEER